MQSHAHAMEYSKWEVQLAARFAKSHTSWWTCAEERVHTLKAFVQCSCRRVKRFTVSTLLLCSVRARNLDAPVVCSCLSFFVDQVISTLLLNALCVKMEHKLDAPVVCSCLLFFTDLSTQSLVTHRSKKQSHTEIASSHSSQ